MWRFTLSCFVVLGSGLLWAQQSTTDFSYYIDSTELKKHVYILAADSMEGRDTGSKGQQKAARYIQQVWKENAVMPYTLNSTSYVQTVFLYKKERIGSITVRTKKGSQSKTYTAPDDLGILQACVKYSKKTTNIARITQKEAFSTKKDYSSSVLIVELASVRDFSAKEWKNVRCAAVLFLVNDFHADYFKALPQGGLSLTDVQQTAPFMFLPKEAFPKGKKLEVSIAINPQPQVLKSENLIAFIEGSDLQLKEEVIVLSAHYDHIGMQGNIVYNGADDNGTGTAALLELAQAFQVAKQQGAGLKRSIAFIAMTGEEHGLLGSAYYSEHPIIPLKQTITNLNVDMIGRSASDEKERFRLFVIGSSFLSNDLHQYNERALVYSPRLEFDYTYNTPEHPLRLYYRSDHYNFAKNNIPSIFYFGGFHDDYHQAGDDADKIDYQKLETIARHIFYTACLIGNAPERPRLNE